MKLLTAHVTPLPNHSYVNRAHFSPIHNISMIMYLKRLRAANFLLTILKCLTREMWYFFIKDAPWRVSRVEWRRCEILSSSYRSISRTSASSDQHALDFIPRVLDRILMRHYVYLISKSAGEILFSRERVTSSNITCNRAWSNARFLSASFFFCPSIAPLCTVIKVFANWIDKK